MEVVNKRMIRFRSGPPCLDYRGSFPFPLWEYLIFAFHRSVHISQSRWSWDALHVWTSWVQVQRLVALHGVRSDSFGFRYSTISAYRGGFLAFY